MLPNTATPSTLPMLRVVSLTAEPTPAMAGGSSRIDAEVAADMASPMPALIDDHGQHVVPVTGRSRSAVAKISSPAVTTARPSITGTRTPARLASVAPTGLNTTSAAADGSARTPAASGL